MISISFELTPDDLLEFSSEYWKSSTTVKSAMRLGWICGTLLLAFLGLLFIDSDRLFGIFMCVGAVGFAVTYPALYRSSTRRTMRKMLNERAMESQLGDRTLEFSEQGIRSVSSDGEGTYRWKAVTHQLSTANHLMIFLGGAQGFVIPRSQVSDSAIREIEEMVAYHIGTTHRQ